MMAENKTATLIAGLKRGGKFLIIVGALVWVLSGIYVVGADEAGVVRQFGKVLPTPVKPGIHYHLPYPIAQVVKPKVTEVKSLTVGFSDQTEEKLKSFRYFAQEEAEYVSGDENILHGKFTVKWSISDPIAYLTQVSDTQSLLQAMAESAFMAKIGQSGIDEALTSMKNQILSAVRQDVQSRLDALNAGIGIVALDLKELAPPPAVAGAFKEVASAREDAARLIHEAEGNRNEALPKARGEANRRLSSAQAYTQKAINRATGDADRFKLMVTEYKKKPDVTRQRLYLEVMDDVLPRMKKYLVGSQSAERATKVTIFMDELEKGK